MPTKTFDYASQIYAHLSENGTQATEGFVFEGSLKAVVTELEIPADYYQRARNLLGKMDCIRYLRTGHGTAPSLIHLIQPPTEELYNRYRENNSSAAKSKRTTNEIVYARLADMARRIDSLENDMRTLMGVVREDLARRNVSDDD